MRKGTHIRQYRYRFGSSSMECLVVRSEVQVEATEPANLDPITGNQH